MVASSFEGPHRQPYRMVQKTQSTQSVRTKSEVRYRPRGSPQTDAFLCHMANLSFYVIVIERYSCVFAMASLKEASKTTSFKYVHTHAVRKMIIQIVLIPCVTACLSLNQFVA